MVVTTKWGDMVAAMKPTHEWRPVRYKQLLAIIEKTIGFETNGTSRQALGTLAVGCLQHLPRRVRRRLWIRHRGRRQW